MTVYYRSTFHELHVSSYYIRPDLDIYTFKVIVTIPYKLPYRYKIGNSIVFAVHCM